MSTPRPALYHFTSRHHVDGCLKEGVRLGVIVQSIDPPSFKAGYQWLTVSGSFVQEWEMLSSLPYRRNEYRLTVEIPEMFRRGKLLKWSLYGEKLTTPTMLKTLNQFGDPDNWYVYHGMIRPAWITDCLHVEEATHEPV